MFEKKTIRGVPKSEENLSSNAKGYHVFGQNIKYQYPQKVLMSEKYLQKVDTKQPILAYASSVGEVGIICESFYRTGDNGAFQGLFSKEHKFSKKELLFILPAIQKHFDLFGYDTGMANTMDLIIKLPVKDGAVDSFFMESFIAELEAERVAELSAYLKVNGLDNYELSKEEEKLIEEISNIEFKGFDITDIFDIYNTHNILSRDIVEGSGMIPYLCASSENNSISSYIAYQESFKEKGNCVFIGGKTFVVTYQKDDFFSNDSHNLALYLKGSNPNRLNQLYLVTCIYKSLAHKYSWGDSVSKTKIKKDKLFLPTINGKPDYELMERIIRTVQKLVVKDVVQYAEQKISATKGIVNKGNE